MNSALSFLRKSEEERDLLLVVLNFTPVPRENYRVGVPRRGLWTEVLKSDAAEYQGSGKGNMGGVETAPVPLHGRSWSLTLDLPPLGVIFLKAPALPAGEKVEEEASE